MCDGTSETGCSLRFAPARTGLREGFTGGNDCWPTWARVTSAQREGPRIITESLLTPRRVVRSSPARSPRRLGPVSGPDRRSCCDLHLPMGPAILGTDWSAGTIEPLRRCAGGIATDSTLTLEQACPLGLRSSRARVELDWLTHGDSPPHGSSSLPGSPGASSAPEHEARACPPRVTWAGGLEPPWLAPVALGLW